MMPHGCAIALATTTTTETLSSRVVVGSSSGDLLQGAVMVNKAVKYCVLRHDRLSVFMNRRTLEASRAPAAPDLSRTAGGGGWDLMLDDVVQISAQGNSSVKLLRSAEEAQVMQASDKARKMLLGGGMFAAIAVILAC
jgi:hypothetical protein